MSAMIWSTVVVVAPAVADSVAGGLAAVVSVEVGAAEVAGTAAAAACPVLDGADATWLSSTALALAVEFWLKGAAAAGSPAPPPPQADKKIEINKGDAIAMRFKSLLLKLRIGVYLH